MKGDDAMSKLTTTDEYNMIESKHIEHQERVPDTLMMPSTFDSTYVQNVVKPFFLSGVYSGERPLLPMIDLMLSKEAAIPVHLFGMLYDSWKPNFEEEGLSVFFQGYENRGPNNERKKIYYSAVTPDLYGPMYSDKIKRFLDQLFDKQHSDKPLMKLYYQNYFNMYWDLHLGVTGDDIPPEVRQIGHSFMTVLGFVFPTLQVVHDNYMLVRQLRQPLKDWIDQRVRDVIDSKVPNPEKTMVYYWIKNGALGENFRQKDIVFECFHNFVAFSQWGNTLYNIMALLDVVNGDKTVCSWFEKTMTKSSEEVDNPAFTPLDRFVMELLRIISPNAGSSSSLAAKKHFFGAGYTGYNTITTSHSETSRDPRHWKNPNDFDPDRYKTVTTAEQNDEARCKAIGLARCPFSNEAFKVKDGRLVEVANSAFGTVYGVIDGKSSPICDDAGYAPFGFGYRHCPGELLTIGFVKDFLRKAWSEKIEFLKLNIANPELLAVGPQTVVQDNIGFKKAK
jgi:hypothetical protein